jgi:hypothetical protein
LEWEPLPNRKKEVDMMEALTRTEEFSAKTLKRSIAAGYISGYFTSPILLYTTGRESQTGHER